MKISLTLGSILLMAPTVAQAQFQPDSAPEKAPSLQLPPTPVKTPALDAFASASTQLQLQARWVRIDSAALLANLPAWSKTSTRNPVATPDELKTLEILRATGMASLFSRQISALNNQATELWFAPLDLTGGGPRVRKLPGALDERIIPRAATSFAAAPYIPNLAKPESKLPEMAPMPGKNGNLGARLIEPLPAPNPYSRPLVGTFASKFQLRPTITGERIALELRRLDVANGHADTATLNPGETAVFSLPDRNFELSKATMRRNFLLITPRAIMQPRPGQTTAMPGHFTFIMPQSLFLFTP